MKKLGTIILVSLAAATVAACSSTGDTNESTPRETPQVTDLLKACTVAMTPAQLTSVTTPPCGCVNPVTGEVQACPVTPPMTPPPPPPPACQPGASGAPGRPVAIIDLPPKIAPLAFYSYGTCGDPVTTCNVNVATGKSVSGAPYLHTITTDVFIGQIVVDPITGFKRLQLYAPTAPGTSMSFQGVPVPLVAAGNGFADTTNPVVVGGVTYYTVFQVDTRPSGLNCITNLC